MTREEAIESIQDFTGWFKKDKPIYKALEMAIKALEQEPCDDVVSRQAVLDIVCGVYEKVGFGWGESNFYKAIQELPSVRPQEQTKREIEREYLFQSLCEDFKKLQAENDNLRKRLEQEQTGRWIMNRKLERRTCDNCNTEYRWSFYPHNFCPNCGAKMVEPQESEVRNENNT